MKAVLSPPSDGGEVQSKGPVKAGSRRSSWTNEKHMLYLNSLEDSFVNQLNGSQFHLHLMNLLGRSGTNQRQSDSSITTESPSDASQFKSMQKGCQEDLKFVETNPGAQKKKTSFSLPEIQWIKHFAPNIGGKMVNIRENCQVVDHQSSYSSKSVKRERYCHSKESTSQAQPSSSSQNGDGYGEVSDQNFIKEEVTGAESRQSYKKKRLSSPVPPPFIKQAVLGKQNQDAVTEKG